ncbi:MAG: cupin domain-containing protein [Actinomycetota bacterium]
MKKSVLVLTAALGDRRQSMRRKRLLGLSLIAMALVMAVGVAVATPGSGVTAVPLASAQIDDRVRLQQGEGKTTVVADFTLTPGGTTGWHSHPGKTLVLVTAGEFTLYRDRDGRCRTRTYGPGEGFVEPPSSVHVGVNEGDTNVKLVGIFFRVGDDGVTRIDKPDPGVC